MSILGTGIDINLLETALGDQRLPQQHETNSNISEQFQIRGGVKESLSVVFGHAFEAEVLCYLNKLLAGSFKSGHQFTQFKILASPSEELFSFCNKSFEKLSPFDNQFATHQVQGLNTICTLIDGGDLAVPQELLHRVFLAVAVASQYLDGGFTDPKAHVAAIGFANRDEDVNEVLILFSLLVIFGRTYHVVTKADVIEKSS